MIERLLPIFASLLAATLRVRWSGAALPERAVIMFWHGKMFAGWYAVRMQRPIALVSKSKDGGLLASVLRSWGYALSRGSSKKGGREALDVAIQAIKNDGRDYLVITPDGPKGPYHKFKRGAFLAASETGLPLYMLKIRYSAPVLFTKSWDRFELPKPFSKVTIEVLPIDISDFPQDTDGQRIWLDKLSISIDH